MSTVTAGIQVLPNGKDMETEGAITKIVELIKKSGMNYQVGPMETVVEGQLDDVFHIVKQAQVVGINMGADEVITNIKIHYKPSGIAVEDKLAH